MADMNIAKVADLYKNAAKPLEGASAQAPLRGPAFTDLVGDALKTAEGHLKTSETVTQDMAKGKADIADVAAAVSQAEVTLQTVISIRDTMVQSFREIMQMPI